MRKSKVLVRREEMTSQDQTQLMIQDRRQKFLTKATRKQKVHRKSPDYSVPKLKNSEFQNLKKQKMSIFIKIA